MEKELRLRLMERENKILHKKGAFRGQIIGTLHIEFHIQTFINTWKLDLCVHDRAVYRACQ